MQGLRSSLEEPLTNNPLLSASILYTYLSQLRESTTSLIMSGGIQEVPEEEDDEPVNSLKFFFNPFLIRYGHLTVKRELVIAKIL